MNDFKDEYGFIVGLVFMISTSILIVNFTIELYKLFHEVYTQKKINKNTKKLLNDLDEYKRFIVY